MKRGTFKYLEQILIDYPDYDKRIRRRREEIEIPWREIDENVGGGKSSISANGIEKIASALIEDKMLCRMEDEQTAVRKALDISHPTMRAVIETYYFKRPRLLTWEGVAQECYISADHAKKVRTAFFKVLAKELGMDE